MCQAFEETRREGYERGLQQGMQQAMIDNIRNLMETFHLNAAQAMEALKIPASEQSKYLTMLWELLREPIGARTLCGVPEARYRTSA